MKLLWRFHGNLELSIVHFHGPALDPAKKELSDYSCLATAMRITIFCTYINEFQPLQGCGDDMY